MSFLPVYFVKALEHINLNCMKGRLASTPADVRNGIRSSTIACLLLHKTMSAVKSEGRYKASLLLQDWMVIQATNCIRDHRLALENKEVSIAYFDSK